MKLSSDVSGGRKAAARARSPRGAAAPWTFLTNHAHVLLCIAQDDQARVRDVASRVGVTERAVHRILSDLEEAGYLKKQRDGRRNQYEVCGELPLRHPVERHCQLADLVSVVVNHRSRAKR